MLNAEDHLFVEATPAERRDIWQQLLAPDRMPRPLLPIPVAALNRSPVRVRPGRPRERVLAGR